MTKIKHECGVMAVFNSENAGQMTYFGLHALQHRGQEGCGIATANGSLTVKKGSGLLSEVFSTEDIKKLSGHSAVGHVRYSTAGGNNPNNVQPFLFMHRNKKFALSHNGNLTNAPELKNELEDMGTLFHSTSDTEIVGHYLIREKGNIHDALLKIMPKFVGAFNFTILEQDKLHIVRDKWGFRPLCLGKKGDAWLVASESSALNVLHAEFIRDIEPGEVLTISKDGLKSSVYGKEDRNYMCAMEYIYFARPDSDIEGINVHSFRKQSGRVLAKTDPVEADIVIPVPDSSLSAASGYSEASGIPNEMGLVKNRYIARTFIEPTQELREMAVYKKLSAVPSTVKGKRVILVDDSIVRGTTIKQIIRMIKRAGATEVHVRIASPKIIAPAYYGIDISTYKELIGHKRTTKEIATEIGADSLAYLTVDQMQEIAGPVGLETSIFTDVYPTTISPEIKDVNK